MYDIGSMSKKEFKRAELEFELRHEDRLLHTTKTRAKKMASKSYPTQDVLATAVAAHRINGTYEKYAQRFSENKPTRHSNKEMVKFHFAKKEGGYVDDDFVDFEVTADDYAEVENIRNHFKRYSMELLGDNLSQFQKDLFALISHDEVPVNKLGPVSYIPELVKREQHENSVKKTIRVEYRDSQHVGKEKDTVEGVIKILDKRWSAQWETFNYTAVLDGNIVSFMNKFEHEIGAMKRIKAKVKSHTQNRLFSANETRLNYVKLYKV